MDQFAEASQQVLGHGPRLAGPDHTIVDLDDRNQLGAAAGQEALVGDVHVVSREWDLAHFEAGGVAQLQHGGAGDAGQDPGVDRRRQQQPTVYQKDVVPKNNASSAKPGED